VRILVIGGGGREHALAWKLSQHHPVVAIPGNPGIAQTARTIAVDPLDVEMLATTAEREGVDLTIVGPELPLSRGIVDVFDHRGLPILGPTRAAARLESSKAFAKDFMARHGIPTARYRVCADAETAYRVIASAELGFPLVVKADGLAAGKGVVIAADRAAADSAVAAAMEEHRFGDAGARVVLEECLSGPEVSFFALCDGHRAQPLGSAQDHKRIFDDDRGPNTGGMGAFAPSPLVDAPMQDRIMREVVNPVLAGMEQEGTPYRGFLYVGLMLTCDGPRVIEFNVRFGDPEAQVIIPLIDGDWAPRLAAAAAGGLDPTPVPLRSEKMVGVVVASEGYPDSGRVGLPISGIEQASRAERVLVFHSGTRTPERNSHTPSTGIATAGGRVLTVVGGGSSYEEAIDRAYEGVSMIRFEGMQYRKDIGRKAIHV
jgi:phosphoribosylamine---glycine ligase